MASRVTRTIFGRNQRPSVTRKARSASGIHESSTRCLEGSTVRAKESCTQPFPSLCYYTNFTRRIFSTLVVLQRAARDTGVDVQAQLEGSRSRRVASTTSKCAEGE